MDLVDFQAQQETWSRRNFPGQFEKGNEYQPLLGVAEEVGELCHAHLKRDQSIRGMTEDQFLAKAGDAVGDIMIYLASYCNANELELNRCLEDAWAEVSKRDWIKFPINGVTE